MSLRERDRLCGVARLFARRNLLFPFLRCSAMMGILRTRYENTEVIKYRDKVASLRRGRRERRKGGGYRREGGEGSYGREWRGGSGTRH